MFSVSNYCRLVALYYRHYGRFYLDVVILNDPAPFDYIDWNNLFIFIKISRTYLIVFFFQLFLIKERIELSNISLQLRHVL